MPSQSDIIRDIARRSRKPAKREPDVTYGAMANALLMLRWAEWLMKDKPRPDVAAITAFRAAGDALAPHVPDYLERP